MAKELKAVLEKIEQASRLLVQDLDAEAVEAVLKERSRRMAEADEGAAEREALYSVVAVRRGESVLGFPAGTVKEIRKVTICAMPWATRAIAGLFHVRGESFCAIDVQPLFGEAERLAHGAEALVALVEGPQGCLGVIVDEVLGPKQIFQEDVERGLEDRKTDFITAVTKDLTAIVDVEAFLGRREFVLDARIEETKRKGGTRHV